MEEWREVTWLRGHKGTIEVSNFGRIRRGAYRYQFTNRWGDLCETGKPAKVLTPYTEKNGYPSIALMTDGKRKKYSIHRMVGRAFVDGYAQGLTINHINGIKTDNRVENLEWVTLSRNTELQWETGLVNLRGDNHPNRKLSSGQVRIIRDLLRLGATMNQLAVLIGVSISTIKLIKEGKRWNSIE